MHLPFGRPRLLPVISVNNSATVTPTSDNNYVRRCFRYHDTVPSYDGKYCTTPPSSSSASSRSCSLHAGGEVGRPLDTCSAAAGIVLKHCPSFEPAKRMLVSVDACGWDVTHSLSLARSRHALDTARRHMHTRHSHTTYYLHPLQHLLRSLGYLLSWQMSSTVSQSQAHHHHRHLLRAAPPFDFLALTLPASQHGLLRNSQVARGALGTQGPHTLPHGLLRRRSD